MKNPETARFSLQIPDVSQNNSRSLKRDLRTTIVCLSGTTWDFFDFNLYGLCTVFIFPKIFFSSVHIGYLGSSFAFFMGFICRPLGAIVMSHVSNTWGNRYSLSTLSLATGIATCTLGALPTYNHIGLISSFLLIFLRCIQSLALGGSWSNSIVYVMENINMRYRGILGGMVNTGGFIAQIIIYPVAFALTSLPYTLVLNFLWRIPFLVGGICIIVNAKFIQSLGRKSSPNTPRVQHSRSLIQEIKTVFSVHRNTILHVAALRQAEVTPYFLLTFYLIHYSQSEFAVPTNLLISVTTLLAVLSLFSHILFGKLSDIVGAKPLLLWGSICTITFVIPLFLLFGTKNILIFTLAYLIFQFLAHDAINAVEPVVFVDLFPPKFQNLGVGIGSQIGATIGGLMPFVIECIGLNFHHTELYTEIIIILSGVVTFLATLMITPNSQKITH